MSLNVLLSRNLQQHEQACSQAQLVVEVLGKGNKMDVRKIKALKERKKKKVETKDFGRGANTERAMEQLDQNKALYKYDQGVTPDELEEPDPYEQKTPSIKK
jgi:hypothetical protein